MTQRRQSIIVRAIERTKSFLLPEYKYSNTLDLYTVNSSIINKPNSVQSLFDHIKKRGIKEIVISGHTKACIYTISNLDMLNTDSVIDDVIIHFSVSDESKSNTGEHKSHELQEMINSISNRKHSFKMCLIVDCSENDESATSIRVLQILRDVYKPSIWALDRIKAKVLYQLERHAVEMANIIKDINNNASDLDIVIEFFRPDIQLDKRIAELSLRKYVIDNTDLESIENTYTRVHHILDNTSQSYRNDEVIVYFNIGSGRLDKLQHTTDGSDNELN